MKAMLTDDSLFGKGTMPANEAFRPLAQSGCYLVKKLRVNTRTQLKSPRYV